MYFFKYLYLIRINNWIKNLIVILPVFFAGKLFALNENEFMQLLFTFFSFCLSASFIYIINDFIDVEKDRLHPEKRKRPIASGAVSKKGAIVVAIFLILILIFLVFRIKWQISIAVLTYIVMNLFYCFGMKNIAIIDVASISLGFVLRILAGGISTNVVVTHWLIILVFLLMFSVALAKRRDDLILGESNNNNFRKSQSGYSLQFIDTAKSISFAVTLVTYIIYCVSDDVVARLGSQYIYVTSLPVFLGIMRYLQLSIVFKNTGSPVKLLFKDKFLISTIIIWLLIFALIIYV